MAQYCCDMLRSQLEATCARHPDRFDCPDALLNYSSRFDEYGIIVHDGGTSSIRISFCPWCGTKLPASQRDRWFDELRAQGIDPWEDSIPAKYQTDEWYRRR